jgi:hypothetical protein
MKEKEICWCYEKFKKDLPSGIKTTCFKDNCANYRKHKYGEEHTKKAAT